VAVSTELKQTFSKMMYGDRKEVNVYHCAYILGRWRIQEGFRECDGVDVDSKKLVDIFQDVPFSPGQPIPLPLPFLLPPYPKSPAPPPTYIPGCTPCLS